MQDRVPTSLKHFSFALLTAVFWLGANGLSIGAVPENVLLDFTAKWCGPCREMSPIVSRLERENLPIVKVDIDAQPDLARQYNVKSIPCFVLVANGREVNRIVGPTSESTLRKLVMALPKPSSDLALSSKSPKADVRLTPTSSSGGSKKLLPQIPPLFTRNSESQLASNSDPATVRGQNADTETSGEIQAKDPLAASTRIRVKDGARVHFGSGTIISSLPNRAIILTCGHIFRDLAKDAIVEVDVYMNGKNRPQTVIGKVLKFDLTSDLGLVEIVTDQPVPSVRLKPLSDGLAVKEKVRSVGCGGGDRPSLQNHVITSINRYRGPDNIECNGAPQQGRSGGGLFMNSELIGVCIAADPKDERGIYTGMKPISQLLAKVNLGHLVGSPSATEGMSTEDRLPQEEIAAVDPPADNDLALGGSDEFAGIFEEATRGMDGGSAGVTDYVGAEIVCIVRPKTPGTPCRVVIVNQATSRFVNDLLHEPGTGTPADSPSTVKKGTRKAVDGPGQSKADSTARMAMQKPNVEQVDSKMPRTTVETSFEPQRYRRKRD